MVEIDPGRACCQDRDEAPNRRCRRQYLHLEDMASLVITENGRAHAVSEKSKKL